MKVITFGEIMGRLSPPDHLRLRQTLPGSLEVTFAGAEANVAASLATLGRACGFVTALPRNPLADACLDSLRARNIDTQHIVRTDYGRVGLYFVEAGANQRPSLVVYDRDHSAISQTNAESYGWQEIFRDAGWLHVTGITPAISSSAAEATLAALAAAKEAKLTVSCDLNFRKKLWRWNPEQAPRDLAESTMRRVLPFVDVVVANEEDCSDVLGIQAADTDVHAGQIAVDRYPDVARQLVKQFPNVSKVGITLRESFSASHNDWGGMLYDRDLDQAFFAPMQNGEYRPYEIKNIVDRVGAGDAFAAGLIFSLSCDQPAAPGQAVQFAVAASCLAHSIVGDFNFSNLHEIEALMGGSTSGRVVR